MYYILLIMNALVGAGLVGIGYKWNRARIKKTKRASEKYFIVSIIGLFVLILNIVGIVTVNHIL